MRQEFVSPEGLRVDGRRPQELRAIAGSLNCLPRADGSAVLSFGNTRVIATVYGPHEVRLSAADFARAKSSQVHDRAALQIQLHAAAFSSSGGERRQGARTDKYVSNVSLTLRRRLMEWSRLLTEAFGKVVILTVYPRTQIDVFVEIINADGSVMTTAVNAITLALLNAGIPMRDYLVATSAIYFAGQRGANGLTVGAATVVDPNRMEEVSQAPIIRAMLLGRTQEVIGMTVERRLPADRLSSMMTAVAKAGATIFAFLETQIVRPALSTCDDAPAIV